MHLNVSGEVPVTLPVRRRLVMLGVAALAAGAGFAVWQARSKRRFEAVDITGAAWGRGFDLVDHHGTRRTHESFRGRAQVIAAVWVAVSIASTCAAASVKAPAADAHAEAEVHLKQVLDHAAAGRRHAAMRDAETLVARHPNFRLAHLVLGDLLRIHMQPDRPPMPARGAAIERLGELRAELELRLRAYREHPDGERVPQVLMQLEPSQRHAIVVDAGRARIYAFENVNGTPTLVQDFYASLGRHGINKEREGDRKTPIGVYHVTAHIPGARLPDLYGWGAYPISYPNEWDRRRGRTGHGIWIHGVPRDSYARSPLASDGCIALANPELELLAARLEPGRTPVLIAERVDWISRAQWRFERDAFLRSLEAWRLDWESRNSENYLAHYALSFRSDDMDRNAWAAHKRRVNAAKSWIKVELRSVGLLRSPGNEPLVEVTFEQDYRSNSLSQRTRKRQYWTIEDGRWRIAYEAPVRVPRQAYPESFPGSPG